MPQDGSNNYYYPPGTPGVPDQTIESEAYNTFLNDLVNNDLNIARPVHRGGTGASAADQGLVNLAGEKATQLVTNFDSHVWLPGSFRSTNAAGQAAPVDGHAFAGICYLNEPFVYPPTNQNLIVEARDESDTVVPGRVYVRQKKAGIWDAGWVEQAGSSADLDTRYVNTAGDTMTGLLTLFDDPTADLHSVTKRYVDGGVGGLSAGKVDRDGDTMTGLLTLSGDPTADLHAVPKRYAAPLDALAYSGMQINGSGDVSQQYGFNIQQSSGYFCDGWGTTNTGTMVSGAGAYTTSIVDGISNCIAGMVSTAQPSLGAGDLASVTNYIEGYRIARLAWGTAGACPITLAFWSRHVRIGTYTGTIRNVDATRSYGFTYTQNNSDISEYKVITILGCVDGTWNATNGIGMLVTFCRGSGTTFTAPSANTWLTGNYVASPGQVNAVAATSDIFRITGVTVLPGIHTPTAAQSPLIMRPYGEELLTCQRYYESSQAQALVFTGNITVGNAYAATSEFKVTKRAVPSIITFDEGSSGFPATTITAPTVQHLYAHRVASAGISYGYWLGTYTADARL